MYNKNNNSVTNTLSERMITLKKITALIIAFALLLSFCGCGVTGGSSSSHASSVGTDTVTADVNSEPEGSVSSGIDTASSETASSEETISSDIGNVPGNPETTDSNTQPSVPSAPPSPTITNGGGNSVIGETEPEEHQVSENVDNKVESPKVDEEITVATNHQPLAESSYYQYSTLTAKEKGVYKRIVTAIKNTENVIDVSADNLTYSDAQKILQRAIADNPQCFWLSKTTSIYYTGADKIPCSIVLYYTDGQVNDVVEIVNNKLTLTTTADRTKIGKQIEQFNSKIKTVVDSIPVSASQTEKEKIIFTYVASHVDYDNDSASKSFQSNQVMPRCFDSYGALIEGKAVCEGYSKLFQYLCYCVGINATQVVGTGAGGGHMWNAVQIDGKWYQSDPTWSSYSNSDAVYYGYLLLTKQEMLASDHTITSEFLSVPE